MMRIEIYEAKKQSTEEPIRLRLIKDSLASDFVLAAVDEDGSPLGRGYLLRINHDGTFKRYEFVSEELGLPLDGFRRVIVK